MFSQFTSLFHRAPKGTRILHITDNEGMRFMFDAFKKSSIVSYNPDNGLHFKKISEKPFFIFGGDATDRGPYNLSTLELLLDFKKRHPENVVLLVGNREIKNNRFKIELNPDLIRERLLHGQAARWIAPQQQSLPLDYVKSIMSSRGKQANAESIQEFVHTLSIAQCQLIYLRWMLEKNMGSGNTFRFHRDELKQRLHQETVSDEEVLQSFLKESQPDGLMGEYLQQAQVGVIVPDTRVMAIHGGITTLNLGRVPDMQPNDKPIANAQQWIDALNKWYAQQIQSWKNLQPAILTEPGFTALDESVLPLPNKPKYVITADMLSPERRFLPIPHVISEYLIKNNISIVLTGHQPSTDHPVLLRSDEDNIFFVNGDTGYAQFDPKNPDDTRGLACHTLEMAADREQVQINLQATLLNGDCVKTNLTVTATAVKGDPYIGKLLDDGQLIQFRLPDGNYRLAQQAGFKASYAMITPEELEKRIKPEIYKAMLRKSF